LDVIWNYAKSVALYQVLLYRYMCMYVRMYVCIYICVCVYAYICTYVCNNFLSSIFKVWDCKEFGLIQFNWFDKFIIHEIHWCGETVWNLVNVLQYLFSKVIHILTAVITWMYYCSCTWADYIQKVYCAVVGSRQTVQTALSALDCVNP
jgi:hypothetical protein